MKAIGSGRPMNVPNASRMIVSAAASSVSCSGWTVMSGVSSILDCGFIIAPLLILDKQLKCATQRVVKQTVKGVGMFYPAWTQSYEFKNLSDIARLISNPPATAGGTDCVPQRRWIFEANPRLTSHRQRSGERQVK